MQPMGYAPAPGMGAPATYEFSDYENTMLARTARWAKLSGIISLIAGVLLLILGILMIVVLAAAMATAPASSSAQITPATVVALGVSLIPSALVSIVGGVFYLMSGNSLNRVVETQGDDVRLLMGAIQSLTRAFMIEAIALVVTFVISFTIGLTMKGGA